MQNQIPKDPLINNSNLINIVTNGMNDDKSDSFPVVSQSPVKESARGDGKDGPLITPRAPIRSRFSRPARLSRAIQIETTGEGD